MRIRSYALGLQEIGVPVEVWAGYSSAFNQQKFNTLALGTWKGIPYRILSGTARFRHFLPWKGIIWLLANLNLLLLLRKKRNQNIHWLAYMPLPSGLWLAMRLASRCWNFSFTLIETELFSLSTEGKKRKFYQELEARKKQVASRILVLTPQLEQAYLSLPGRAQIRRITPVVAELDALLRIQCPESKTLGYIGTFGVKDGVDTMLRAFETARIHRPELKFHLSGKAAQVPEAWPEGAEYTGAFRADKLPELIQSCDTLILNRRNDAYSQHGFPIKLAEYTASGIPVLLCDFPFYREFFSEEEVWYFKPDDASDLARAILARYSHPELALRMADAARFKCKQLFSPQATASELIEIL